MTCDSVCLDSFIWRDFAGVQWAAVDDRAVIWLMETGGEKVSAMPSCEQEDLRHYFELSVDYFNNTLGIPFRIMLADEAATDDLGLKEDPRFTVTEERDLRDYLYDADALRTLSGKKLHKKKNHLNYFLKEYEGRYEYRRLGPADRESIIDFLNRWEDEKGDNTEIHLPYELKGVRSLIDNCGILPGIGTVMAGVTIDGTLEAFTVGSLNPYENMAVIHIEKAAREINGLYQYINRQFLVEEFPGVRIVNREDDLGEPSLRQAKESYHPMDYARKYKIMQRV